MSSIGLLLTTTAVTVATTCCNNRSSTVAHAATTPGSKQPPLPQQVEEDKMKIYQGYIQLNYLLDHWEEETTICGRSGDNPYISKNGCDRSPVKIMDYLGYKDINHPLFKADKTMRRLQPYIPNNTTTTTTTNTDREADFLEAMESWMIAAEAANGMAYISSWGESNPGGGKDRVQLFIERARTNVVQARDSLRTIVDLFDIQSPGPTADR